MANNFNINPIFIDTAMTSSYKSLVSASQGLFISLLVEKVYWENPAAIGDTVTIEDPSSGILLPLRAEVANQSQLVDWSASPKLWRDFYVAQISSGVLYIYLR